MSYCINGINISETTEQGRHLYANPSDFAMYFYNGGLGTTFLATASPGFFYSEPYDKYLHNGVALLAKKGCRPTYYRRYGFYNADTAHYLIKFANKEVRVCTENIPYTDDPTGRGVLLFESDRDVKYAFLTLYGAGGAGAGGGTSQSGAGGASGGFVNCCVKLEHDAGEHWAKNCLPISIGKGGLGKYGNYDAATGNDTGLYINNEVGVCAAGGGGAQSGGTPGVPKRSFCSGIPFIHAIDVWQGTKGMAPGRDGSVEYIQTTPYSTENSYKQLTMISPSKTSSARGGHGGGGYFIDTEGIRFDFTGIGGQNAGDSGGNSVVTSGGGGGSNKSFSGTNGGNGGDGYFEVFY